MKIKKKWAKERLLAALEKRKLFIDFKQKLGIMNSHISFIQKKFINRKVYRDAKIEMLKLYWKQILGWFFKKSCDIGDPQLKFVSANMMNIDKNL